MTDPSVRRELLSLVQHVELNQTGWWETAVKQLVLASLWLSTDRSIDGMTESLANNFHVHLKVDQVAEHVHHLCECGQLIHLPDGNYRMPESALADFEENLHAAEVTSVIAQRVFTDLVEECCPSMDAMVIWTQFNQDFLLPLIQERCVRNGTKV